MTAPKAYQGIMVSSTFSDLEGHRREVKGAIEGLGFHANVMENSGPRTDADVIEDSINLVRASAAFIGVISHRYGQTPECPKSNPDCLSISELEFNEAMRLKRPILLFIMGDEHAVKKADIETDAVKIAKLDAFRERAKQMREGSAVDRIYTVFDTREDFTREATIAIGKLSKLLPAQVESSVTLVAPKATSDTIDAAVPPELRAVPRYLGSHEFVGRKSELSTLDDWCAEADQHPMLLFEAIGGSGKSMVTWTWLTKHATHARDDWAGRFWFSFYEGGATMTSFCQEALAYMTGQPVKAFRKEKIRTLMPQLIAKLEARPWLMVLDGLERILVAYHRIDAPQMRDEDVDTAEDQIGDRNPRATINPADEDLLRQLRAAAPSKLLITSRLTPQALVNASDMPKPGVRREILRGLRPPDAEELIRACGVSGDSRTIQDYLTRNCDCHPLVIGALAGLVNNYRPDRGNFDAWLADPDAGGKMGLADLDLTQRRNHILDASIEALPEPERKLLQTLSLLQGGADYSTLKEFNPHLPTPPKEIDAPSPPEESFVWSMMDDDEKEKAKTRFNKAEEAWTTYLNVIKVWEKRSDVVTASTRFDETLTELEQRGLLQYEHGLKRYDLHPVVRGVASGRMDETETSELGEQVVDHFSSRPHDPWEQAESLEDLAIGIQLVATLTRIGEYERALDAYMGDLCNALQYNLMAYGEMQRILRPFFPNGWDGPPAVSDFYYRSYLLNSTCNVLAISDLATSQRLYERSLQENVFKDSPSNIWVTLGNLAETFNTEGKLASYARIQELAYELADVIGRESQKFATLVSLYISAAAQGETEAANLIWTQLDPMGRDWSRSTYRAGEAECAQAFDMFGRGGLTESLLTEAETLCREGKNLGGICECLALHGEWRLSRGEPKLAIESLNEATRLYRETDQKAPTTEALLTLAQLLAKNPVDARAVAERLDSEPHHTTALPVAEIWQALDEPERAITAAVRAHKSACGSGEPYVYRYYLNRADALLRELGETPPDVPQHDPANDEVFDWEEDVRALIKTTREERKEREREQAEREKSSPDE